MGLPVLVKDVTFLAHDLARVLDGALNTEHSFDRLHGRGPHNTLPWVERNRLIFDAIQWQKSLAK